MSLKNVFKRRKTDYSFRIFITCGDNKYSRLLSPKERQGYVDFNCIYCNRPFRLNSCSFYQADELNIHSHIIEYP